MCEEAYVTDEELVDYVDYITPKMWRVLCACKGGHPYFWPIHDLYHHVETCVDEGGIGEWVDDALDGDVEDFVGWLDQTLAAMELLLRAGKGLPAPKPVKRSILIYLRESNRPRQLTEILGMLAEKKDVYLDRGRLSSMLSVMKSQGLVRYAWCPVRDRSPTETGYWWADSDDPQQLCFEWKK